MKLLSVNVGRPRVIGAAEKARETGIYKRPVRGVVAIGVDGVSGDAVCDTRHHGGRDQAVYVYGEPDYEWWSRRLGQRVSFGAFGENLTISELESSGAGIGDRFLIGSVLLEVTAPRIPCKTLARKMGMPSFVTQFREAERPGLYCRVVRAGDVQIGDPVSYEPRSGDVVTVIELFRSFYEPQLNEAVLRRHLAAPIAIRDRIEKEKQLARLLSRDARRANQGS